MFSKMRQQCKTAITLLLFLTVLTGMLYPALITVLAQMLFPARANGSLIIQQKHPVGSLLIGQPFNAPRYFWGRPSATTPFADNAAASSGSNLATTNPAQREAVKNRMAALKQADPANTLPMPVDLVTASGSGLDPHISPLAAFYQANRIAKTRGLTVLQVENLIQRFIQPRQFGILGESRVNVLQLNLALDKLTP